ncbi:MAG: IclR family transcriptional regulator [Syntrophorhabdales bacterium]|jgi:DNA-binding IclR family transcriptional regulator
MESRDKGGFYNRSLERALQILDAFHEDRQVLTRTQLVALLGLPRATVLRLCSTLVTYGYLAEDKETRQYRLGMRLFEQGSIVFHSLSVRNAASRHLTELQRRIGKTVFLAVLDNGELLYIDKREDAGSAISFTSKTGTRRPPYWGMCGPVLMAYLPGPEVERLLERSPLSGLTKTSFTDKEDFKAWLARIREQGFAIDPGATLDGVTGVGAPVRDFTGRVVAGIGAAIFSFSVDSKELEMVIEEVSRTAQSVSKELGHKQ